MFALISLGPTFLEIGWKEFFFNQSCVDGSHRWREEQTTTPKLQIFFDLLSQTFPSPVKLNLFLLFEVPT